MLPTHDHIRSLLEDVLDALERTLSQVPSLLRETYSNTRSGVREGPYVEAYPLLVLLTLDLL
jgi:hypothetical protein